MQMLPNQQELFKVLPQLMASIPALAIAVTGDNTVDISYVSGETRSIANKLYVGEPESLSQKHLNLWRGYIDRALFKMRYHCPAIERQYRPLNPRSAILYGKIVRFRYELLGISHFPGSRQNISETYFEENIDWLCDEGRGIYYFVQFILPHFVPLVETLEKQSKTQIQNYLNDLSETIDDFQKFAPIAAEYAAFMCNDLEQYQDQIEHISYSDLQADSFVNSDPSPESSQSIAAETESLMNLFEDEDNLDFVDCDSVQGETHFDTEGAIESYFSESDFASDPSLFRNDLGYEYKIFRSDYDIETSAEKLVDPAEADRLYKEFTHAQKDQIRTIQKLARKLRARLISVNNEQNYYDLYEGVLDNQKITKILTDPLDGRYFKDETENIAENTAVSLLIDNSGSMRGKPITMAALCADIIVDTLERCGAKVEVLGFTTQEWRGGQSRKDYEQSGCSPMPGRLNDLLHIIYKNFNATYKKSRKNISVMLKESILKENIDGEALKWAAKRLGSQPEKRQIMLVISDGAPVDDSTTSANGSDYLENHLKKVIHYYENKTDIDVMAIGIGHDVNNYYKKAVTIQSSDDLAKALTEKFVTLF